jgi:hypothetical protein
MTKSSPSLMNEAFKTVMLPVAFADWFCEHVLLQVPHAEALPSSHASEPFWMPSPQ